MTPSRPPWQDAAEEYSRRKIPTCICGGAGYVRIAAPLGDPLFGKAIPCACTRQRLARARAEALRRRSGIDDRELAAWRFETFDPARCRPAAGQPAAHVAAQMGQIARLCQGYAREPRGWLVLTGETGAGKTHLAFAIAAQALADGRSVYAHNTPAMLGMLRVSLESQAFDEALNGLLDVEVFVLDDLGAERPTEWAAETLYRIVNHRYAKRLALVVTANLRLESTLLDPRVLSRLREGADVSGGWSRWVALPCGDFRPAKE